MSEDYEDALLDSKLFRGLVVAALLSGAGNGLISLNKDTSDRIHRTTVVQWREADRAENHRERERLEEYARRIEESHQDHLQHSAKWTQVIERMKEEFDWHMAQEH